MLLEKITWGVQVKFSIPYFRFQKFLRGALLQTNLELFCAELAGTVYASIDWIALIPPAPCVPTHELNLSPGSPHLNPMLADAYTCA